jgi:rSAM/selenodomain-associated transferase 1
MAQARDEVAVAVLAKAPIAGLAKTRLIPVLGEEGAAALQASLTERAVETAVQAAVGPVTLWATPEETHASFRAPVEKHGIALLRQPDGDLGARMLTAVATARGPALVIGTDCPALTPDHLRAAAAALRQGLDAVVIPVEDGGYVLIGLSRAEPALFCDMNWSTSTVVAETRRRLRKLGLTWQEPALLWDIDRPEDLARLAEVGLARLLPSAR